MDALAKQCGIAEGLESAEVLDAVRSQALQMEEDAKALRSKIARIENGTLRSELTAFARVSMRYFPFCIDLGSEYHYSLPATSTVPDSGQFLSVLTDTALTRCVVAWQTRWR